MVSIKKWGFGYWWEGNIYILWYIYCDIYISHKNWKVTRSDNIGVGLRCYLLNRPLGPKCESAPTMEKIVWGITKARLARNLTFCSSQLLLLGTSIPLSQLGIQMSNFHSTPPPNSTDMSKLPRNINNVKIWGQIVSWSLGPHIHKLLVSCPCLVSFPSPALDRYSFWSSPGR